MPYIWFFLYVVGFSKKWTIDFYQSFMTLASAGHEAEWLKDLLLEVSLAKDNVSKMLIHCDSQISIARAVSELYNGMSMHISLRHSFMRKLIKDGIVSLA